MTEIFVADYRRNQNIGQYNIQNLQLRRHCQDICIRFSTIAFSDLKTLLVNFVNNYQRTPPTDKGSVVRVGILL